MNYKQALILFLTSMVLVGCWGDDPEPEVAEIPTAFGATNEGTQEELVYASKRLHESGIHSVAKENLEALKNNYPEGPYVEFAEIKMADSVFSSREYAEAAIMYEDFIKDHPSSTAVPYALLRAGRSHQLSSKGVGRDSEPLTKAAEYFDTLLTEYPTSPYTEAAGKYREKALSDYAETEKMIMEFYKKQGKEAAYEARKAEFDEKWASLIRSEEELEILEDTAPQNVAEGSDPVIESKDVVMAASTYDESARASMRPKARSGGAVISRNIPTDTPRVQQVKCLTEGDQRATIYFTRPLEQSFANELGTIQPTNGKIKIKLPAASTKDIAVDCLREKDLRISSSGQLELDYNYEVQTMVLRHPDRLLLMLD